MSVTEINAKRWTSLQQHRLLEAANASCFDSIVAIAASLCDTPLATLSFNDRTRERFAACHGCELDRIPCEKGFAEHVVHGRVPLLVSDTKDDPRFTNPPLLEELPDVRFYAGVPVMAEDGMPLGTLAVMDTMVRHLPASKLAALEALGSQVMPLLQRERQIDTRGPLVPRKEADARHPDFNAVFQSMPGLHWLIEAETLRVVSVSSLVHEKLSGSQLRVIGSSLSEVLNSGRNDRASREGARAFIASVQRVVKTGKPDTVIAQRYPVRPRGKDSMEIRYWNVVSAPVVGESGKPAFVVATGADVSEMVELREREDKAAEDRRVLEGRASSLSKDILRRSREIERLNEHLNMAQSMTNVGSWTLSPDAPNYWSQEVFEILGIDAHDQALEEDILLAAVHPEDRENFIQHRKQLLEHGQQVEWTHRIVRPDGSIRYVREQLRPSGIDSDDTIYGTLQDVTHQKHVEDELHARIAQQQAVAQFGQRALMGVRLEDLLDEAVELVTKTFDVEYCKVLQLMPDGKTMKMVAGKGWRRGMVGKATVSVGSDSLGGFTLLQKRPVIVEDLRSDTRFDAPQLLHEHGVISGLSVIIEGKDHPWGALGAHSTRPRKFTPEDITFFESIANIIGEVAHFRAVADSLNARNRRLDTLLQLSRKAMRAEKITRLFDFACLAVAEALDVEYVMVTERLDDGSGRKVIAGTGWKKGVVNHAILSISPGSQGEYLLNAKEPVIISDLPVDPRFRPAALLIEHGADSGIAVALRNGEKRLGTISAYTTERRQFTDEEAEFMQQVADMLSEVQA